MGEENVTPRPRDEWVWTVWTRHDNSVLQETLTCQERHSRIHESYVYCKKVLFLLAENKEKEDEMLQKFHDFQRKAEMYYVYHSIQRYTVRLFYTFWRHILAILFLRHV